MTANVTSQMTDGVDAEAGRGLGLVLEAVADRLAAVGVADPGLVPIGLRRAEEREEDDGCHDPSAANTTSPHSEAPERDEAAEPSPYTARNVARQ